MVLFCGAVDDRHFAQAIFSHNITNCCRADVNLPVAASCRQAGSTIKTQGDKMKLTAMLAAATALTALLHAAQATAADEWPNKPIRLVVPFEGGAGTDVVQRFFAKELSNALGQQIVVENIGGAGGAVGTLRVARATPDGYTLLGSLITAVAALPHLQKLQYDSLKDLAPLYRLGYPVTLLGVNKDIGINTMQELIARAKQEPGKLAYGSAGVGSAPQFRFEALMGPTGIQMTHVPYKGGTAYVADLLAGRIHAFADGTIGANLGKAGKVKLLAVLDDARAPDFPDVPAINEVVPAYKVPPTWYIVSGPAGLPPAIKARITGELAKIALKPETAEFMKSLRARPSTDTASFDLTAEVLSAYNMYGDMIKRMGIQPP
jgi:tripartite-type tricarboxylate transporter receptor subunit TctC